MCLCYNTARTSPGRCKWIVIVGTNMLNDEPLQKLAEMIAKHGSDICEHKQRFKGLLLDYCPGYDKEVRILNLLLDIDIPADLLRISSQMSTESLLNRLTAKVCEMWSL